MSLRMMEFTDNFIDNSPNWAGLFSIISYFVAFTFYTSLIQGYWEKKDSKANLKYIIWKNTYFNQLIIFWCGVISFGLLWINWEYNDLYALSTFTIICLSVAAYSIYKVLKLEKKKTHTCFEIVSRIFLPLLATLVMFSFMIYLIVLFHKVLGYFVIVSFAAFMWIIPIFLFKNKKNELFASLLLFVTFYSAPFIYDAYKNYKYEQALYIHKK